jgi:hypothetical protein
VDILVILLTAILEAEKYFDIFNLTPSITEIETNVIIIIIIIDIASLLFLKRLSFVTPHILSETKRSPSAFLDL